MAGWKKILSQPTSADITVPDDSGSVALTGTATTQAFTSISTTGTSYFGNGFSSVNYLEGTSIVKLQYNGASSTVEFAYNDGMDATSDGLIKLAGPVATGGETGNELIRLPIASGTVALTSDITGTNSGTNTGDVCTTNHTAAGYITSVADDTSPQLGGTLNPNGNSIAGTSSFEIGLSTESASNKTLTIRSQNTGSGAGILWLNVDEMATSSVFKDEDTMLSNSDTAMASQQSIKAYVDDKTKYHYHFIKVGFNYSYIGGTRVFLPTPGAESTRELSSASGGPETFTWICPYDGTLERVQARSEEVCGSSIIGFWHTANQVEIAGPFPTSEVTVNMSVDDTTYEFDFTGETNTFSKGDIIMFSFDPANDANDVHFMITLKLDVTT